MGKNFEWYELVSAEGDEGSVFSADTYCNACTKQIKKELKASGKAPADLNDEYSYDSDDYPKDANLEDEESDSPSHCGSGQECLNAIKLPCGSKIGAWLGGSLTGEGVDYVWHKIIDDAFRSSDHSRQVGRLWRYLYRHQLDDADEIVTPDTVSKVMKDLAASHPDLARRLKGKKIQTILVDLDNIYAVGATEGEESVLVCRAAIDALGDFDDFKEGSWPAAMFEGAKLDDVIHEIASDEGWRS